ncbi:MAG: hypothetical protein LBC83_05385 [Oscillospiraceae bacterium]|jgi:electron transport complex protein RnfE|nr:hypothetical protein [Oscillospiraceae bacterium]
MQKHDGPLVTAKERHWLGDAIVANPILVQAVGLAPVVAVATTVRAALLLAAVTAALLLICEPLTAVLLRKLPAWLRVPCYFAIGLALVVPLVFLLESMDAPIVASMDIFLPLLALNSVVAVRCERYAVLRAAPAALRDAAANAAGYAAAALLIGFLRELLGHGSVWGRHTADWNVRGLWMPFGGFLVIGLLAAGLKLLLRTLSEHGIIIGAHRAMELAPEDREVRKEKTRKLFEDAETRRRVLRAAGVLLPEEEIPPTTEPAPAPTEEPPPAIESAARAAPKQADAVTRPLPDAVLAALQSLEEMDLEGGGARDT